MTDSPSPSPAGFESSLQRLEAIVEQLERGESSLADSLRLFEEGVGLARRLEQELAAAEIKVEALLQQASGEETIVKHPLPEDER